MAKFQDNLRPITDIPIIYRKIFSNYTNFNSVQSQVIEDVLNSNKSIVVSAPTGSGKTVIFELAIVNLLMKYSQYNNHQHPHHYQLRQQGYQHQYTFKAIYVAPIKAICSEKYLEWREKFNEYGIKCIEITGDTYNNNNNEEIDIQTELNYANIIITTPEKWNSITQKWKENENFIKSIKLFMIDEIHLLNDDTRGPVLETIVSRMKIIKYFITKNQDNNDNIKNNYENLRFIAVSATIPNIEDIALWLCEDNSISFHKISESERPVPLQKYVLGYNYNLTGFKFDMKLNYILPSIIQKYSNGKPTLIFCNSRKSSEMAVSLLAKNFSTNISLSDNQKIILKKLSKSIHDTKLKDFIQKGLAYHHAGLNYEDRVNIETAFRKSLISVLVSTNTLAMGVNLPAHLVIIKSTETYIRSSYVEYSENTLLQMIGRAGRPQYDENGVAVIMTHKKKVQKYENLINGSTPIESNFNKQLAEHLNSEIVSQTINNFEIAMKWIKSTYFYVRAIKCPTKYGFKLNMTRKEIEEKLEEMCLIQIKNLENNGLIVKDQVMGISLTATQYGRLMAKYYLSFDTIKLFQTICGEETFLEMLNLIVRCKEYSEFTIRVNDKKILNELNEYPIRYPIKGKIKTRENKISCLMQAILGNITIPDISLTQDALRMIRIGERISKSLLEFIRLLQKQSFNSNFYKAILNSTILSKCFRAKLWENSEFVCKQLKKIGPVYSNLLVKAGKITLNELKNTDPRMIEMILGKTPPFGNEILEAINHFPDYWMDVRPKKSNLIEVEIHQENNIYNFESKNGNNCTLIVGDTDNNVIFFNDKIDYEISKSGVFKRILTVSNTKVHAIHFHLIHDTLVGVDRYSSVILNPIETDAVENRKKPKKMIQTKLQVKQIPNDNKNNSKNASCLNIKNGLDEIISLLDTKDNENVKENQNQHYNNCHNNLKLTNNEKRTLIKRKLDNYKYSERPHINKIFIHTNTTDENKILLDEWILDEFREEFNENVDKMSEKNYQSIEINNNHIKSMESNEPMKTDSNAFVTIENNNIPEKRQCNSKMLDFTQKPKLSNDYLKNISESHEENENVNMNTFHKISSIDNKILNSLNVVNITSQECENIKKRKMDVVEDSKYFINNNIQKLEYEDKPIDLTMTDSNIFVKQQIIDTNITSELLKDFGFTKTESNEEMNNISKVISKENETKFCENRSILNFPSSQLTETNFQNNSKDLSNIKTYDTLMNKEVSESFQNCSNISKKETKLKRVKRLGTSQVKIFSEKKTHRIVKPLILNDEILKLNSDFITAKILYNRNQNEMCHENENTIDLTENNEKELECVFATESDNFHGMYKNEKMLKESQFQPLDNLMVTEQNLQTTKENEKEKCDICLRIPSVYEVFKQNRIHNQKSDLANVLESICDVNLSENHKKQSLHEVINSFDNLDSEISSTLSENLKINSEFLQKGHEDKLINLDIDRNSSQSIDSKRNNIQVLRIPVEKQTNNLNSNKKENYLLPNTEFPDFDMKIDVKNYLKTSHDNLKLLKCEDNLNKKGRQYNPYRLQLHQRQKYFMIPKTDNKMKMEFEESQRKITLEKLKIKFNQESDYKEDQYMKDITKCLFTDLNNVKQLISDQYKSVSINESIMNRNYLNETTFETNSNSCNFNNNITNFQNFKPLIENKNEMHRSTQSFLNQKIFDENLSIIEQKSDNLFPLFEYPEELKTKFDRNTIFQNDNEFTADICTEKIFQSFDNFLKDDCHKSNDEIKEEFPIRDEPLFIKNGNFLNFTQDCSQNMNIDENFFLS